MPPNQATMKCGRSWIDASSKCGTLCPTGNATECPTGELCYADVPDYCSSLSTHTLPANAPVKPILSSPDNLAGSLTSAPSLRHRQRTNKGN
mmetsp:Transcript_23657/g.35284  ORF Transcript_23657/g.35284 Transcript_23657/m.35284 type:complete len:92 (+) Transcript_23657:180-455(+)